MNRSRILIGVMLGVVGPAPGISGFRLARFWNTMRRLRTWGTPWDEAT